MPVDPSPHTAGPTPLSGGAVARRSRPIYRVFVSSTWLDLQPERRALMDALNRMEEMRFVGMEFFGNRPDDTHDASIDQVDKCEVFVGIIGHRYGSGITEAEYRRARALNLPCFVYFKREETTRPELTDNDPALAAKLAAFKQELLRGHTVKEVSSPEELAANATADLHNWVAARWISLEQEQGTTGLGRPRGTADTDRTNILRLIERVEQDWVKGVLEASLHHRAWLELGLAWKDEAVDHPWDQILVAPDRPVRTLAQGETIAGVFTGAQETLLILGEPGAGKTTTLLELARALLSKARATAETAAPVVLALSTWTGRHRGLRDWLVDELNLRYQVPKRLAQGWLDTGRLVLLLDGLDEVREDLRSGCVAAINLFFREHAPAGLAVTCRVHEYSALKERLNLRAAICLQPLTPMQVEAYFQRAGSGLLNLRQAMRADEALQEMAQSPLMLSVMTMAWRDAAADSLLPEANATGEQRRRQLFEGYVQTALKRKGAKGQDEAGRRTLGVLSWLAGQMRQRGQTLFSVEQMQPDWLEGTGRQFVYFLLTRVLMALSLALPWWILSTGKTYRLDLLGSMTMVGGFLAVMDFCIFHWGRPETFKPWHRVIVQAIVIGAGPLLLLPFVEKLLTAILGSHVMVQHRLASDFATPLGMFCVLFYASVATLTDVKTRDIRPADMISWSWRQGGRRTAYATLLLQWLMLFGFVETILLKDWAYASREFGFGEAGFWPGTGVGLLVAGFACWRWKMPERVYAVALTGGLALFGGEVGQFFSGSPSRGVLDSTLFVGCLALVFGSLTSGIDESRARRAGAWFWLKIPLLAAFTVAIVTGGVLAGVGLFSAGARTPAEILIVTGIGGVFGLVAFFRFGGFQGMQHFILRRLLSSSGRLPRDPGVFLDEAVRLNLLQKVGFGYRFIHALLMEHFADRPSEATAALRKPTG